MYVVSEQITWQYSTVYVQCICIFLSSEGQLKVALEKSLYTVYLYCVFREGQLEMAVDYILFTILLCCLYSEGQLKMNLIRVYVDCS